MSDELDRQLLSLLAHGGFVSGQHLAQQCGISRTAVWKRLQQFTTRWGLDIHSVRGKGYRLDRAIELLDEQRFVIANPQMNPAPQVHLSLASTSAYLLALSQQSRLANGMTIFAEHQSAGKGRRERHWFSPFASNLYCSMHWRFDCGFGQLGALSLAVGAIVCRLLESYGIKQVGLKWPNDVLVDKRKLAGILIDLHGASEGPVSAIIGIGLNYAMPSHAANLIEQQWIDLNTLGCADMSRNQIALELMQALMTGLPQYVNTGFDAFVDEWRRYDVLLGAPVSIITGEKSIQGRHAGIASDGALVLDICGEKRRYYAGEVSLRGVDATDTSSS